MKENHLESIDSNILLKETLKNLKPKEQYITIDCEYEAYGVPETLTIEGVEKKFSI